MKGAEEGKEKACMWAVYEVPNHGSVLVLPSFG